MECFKDLHVWLRMEVLGQDQPMGVSEIRVALHSWQYTRNVNPKDSETPQIQGAHAVECQDCCLFYLRGTQESTIISTTLRRNP